MLGPSGFVQKHRTGASFVSLLLACVLLILFSNRNVVIQPKKVGQSLFGLFQVGFHSVSSWLRDTGNSIGELQRLREELDSARERLAEYERVSRDLAELRRENDALRAQLGFAQTIPYQYLPARVVARDPGNLFATLVIDRGSHQGVQAGMTVVAFQRGLQGLVGKVVMVGLVTSTVQPVTDPEAFVAARLATTRFDGLVSGSRAKPGSLVMSYVRKLALGEVQYGELVATSGMGRLYPEGIHIGRVREMSAKGYEASLELEVEPIVDLSRLEHVFVLKTGAQ